MGKWLAVYNFKNDEYCFGGFEEKKLGVGISLARRYIMPKLGISLVI
jgi:hypothetical protein